MLPTLRRPADATLTWVCDAIAASADEVAARYSAKSTTDAATIFASGEVDAVLVASPTPTHVDLIAAAVAASVPVLCEKPIDLDIARVEALRATVSAAGSSGGHRLQSALRPALRLGSRAGRRGRDRPS